MPGEHGAPFRFPPKQELRNPLAKRTFATPPANVRHHPLPSAASLNPELTMPTKIECPSCGQHYSLELGDEEVTLTCQKCDAEFTAQKEIEIASPPPRPATRPLVGATPSATPRPGSTSFPRRPGLLDRFMALLFRFGKAFAGVLALIFLLGILISAITFVLNIGTSLDVPDYESITTGSPGSSEGGRSGLDERRALEKAYGDRIAEIIKEHQLEEAGYDGLIAVLSSVDEGNEEAYLDGLDRALGARAKAIARKDDGIPSVSGLIGDYTDAFFEAEARSNNAAAEAKTTRRLALASVVGSCFMLFMMLIIPALLRIEENTRPR